MSFPSMTDVILGAKWLKQVGPMWQHFNAMLLTFRHQSTEITLEGLHSHETAYISKSKAKRAFT